jgi:hypothetical protein
MGQAAGGSPGQVGTSLEALRMEACQMRLVVHQEGKDLGHQGTHPEDQTGCHMVLQGHQTVGSRQEGTDRAEESSVVAAGDRTRLVGCFLAVPGLVVPVAHASRQL